MKLNEQWLRGQCRTELDADAIANRLTSGGIEIASIASLPALDQKIVAGVILSLTPHPEADRLRCCTVDIGTRKPLSVVCGAANAVVGMHAPVAPAGASLPDGTEMQKRVIRGVRSEGMLCSGSDLALESDSEGLLDLGRDALPGTPVNTLLGLPDHVFELEITPNRGDCLSVIGIAREIAFLTGARLSPPRAARVPVRDPRKILVSVEAHEACPRYAGRPVYGLDATAKTPLWMRERLRRCGIRVIHPVVDVTNYVMLELGQPMHGFSLSGIAGGITVRHARKGESVPLLDGTIVSVDAGTLLIADHERALAVAGVMGGMSSAIGPDTSDIFLESAYFRPESIAAASRRLSLHTDSSHRFERGVDPAGTRQALERATELLIEIAGGKPGPVVERIARSHLPRRQAISLRRARLHTMLGIAIAPTQVERLLKRIDPQLKKTAQGWRMAPPAYRFDLKEEHDLVEEVARGYGYEHIPVRTPRIPMRAPKDPESAISRDRVRALLVDRDYHEAITYSFVDPAIEALFDPARAGPALANPIASNLAVMRTGLAPGLLQAVAHNRRHRHERVRLFEMGLCFRQESGGIAQRERLGMVAVGRAWPRQWSGSDRQVDLYDVKGDFMALLGLGGRAEEFTFHAAAIAGMHPGEGAEIHRHGRTVGILGAIHPEVQQRLEIDDKVIMLDIELDEILDTKREMFREIPRVPAIRRDLAMVVPRTLPVQRVLDCIQGSAGQLLTELEVFDEYRGEGIDSGSKSIAVTLTLQDSSRTLTEDAVEGVMARVVAALTAECGAHLRQ
ncbi:MAG: phenylalanine--tRNA ligase subunit beta [Acidiferrobacteraceae bacterium]